MQKTKTLLNIFTDDHFSTANLSPQMLFDSRKFCLVLFSECLQDIAGPS